MFHASARLTELSKHPTYQITMATNYIPSSDTVFALWLANFASLITTDPTAYGLVIGDATNIQAQADAFAVAFAASSNPATRTAPTVAAKDQARAAAEFVVRPYAMTVNANPAVSDMQRADLGLTIRKLVPTPVPTPTTAPALTLVMATPGVLHLDYRDSATPDSKKKPYGTIGVELYAAVGLVPAVAPAAADYRLLATKSPVLVPFDAADAGKLATFYARFITSGGSNGVSSRGPWSAQLVAVVT